MPRYHLRLTLEHQPAPDGPWEPVSAAKLAEALAWIAEVSPGHLVVREDADEEVAHPHYHCVLNSEKGESCLRKKFQEATGGFWKGNAMYSGPILDKKGNLEPYACKGKGADQAPQVIRKGGLYTDQEIARFHAQYWEVAAAARASKRQKSSNMSRAKLADLVEEECRKRRIIAREEIVDVAVDLAREHCSRIDTFHIRGVTNLVWLRLDPVVAKPNICAEILSRI